MNLVSSDNFISAKLLPDLLLNADGTGWLGPVVDENWCNRVLDHVTISRHWENRQVTLTGWHEGEILNIFVIPDFLELDLSRSEVRFQVLDVLRRGLKCSCCQGSGCAACLRKGWLRQPARVNFESIPDKFQHLVPSLIKCSIERVSNGLPPIIGLVSEWRKTTTEWSRHLHGSYPSENFVIVGVRKDFWAYRGWRINIDWRLFQKNTRGPECGKKGRLEAESKLLEFGYAYLEEGNLILPPIK